jgi:formylglycine-generating enzyme required for sulfatase activity
LFIAFALLGLLLLVALWVDQRWRQKQAERTDWAPPPAGMVLVPAGAFTMGSDDPGAEADEHPLRREWLTAFYIDVYEVTNAEYQQVVPGWDYAPDDADKPVTGVTRQEAEAYARAVGKRLPTAAEWEKAARGPDARIYPRGNEFHDGYAHISSDSIVADDKASVGSYARGVSPYGCHDMAGNVWEWVADDYVNSSVFGLEKSIPRGVLKGGAYAYGAFQSRASYLGFEGRENTCNDVGFRCALSATAGQ